MNRSFLVAGLRIAQLSAIVVMAVVLGSIFWSLVPLALGLRSDVVMSGSMSPRIRPGDVVVSVPTDARRLRIGEIINFTDPADPRRRLIHRYIGPNRDGTLTTKGDANGQADSTGVPAAMVYGASRVRIPYAGLVSLWLRTRQTRPLTVTVLGALVLGRLATAASRPTGVAGLADPVVATPRTGRRRRYTARHAAPTPDGRPRRRYAV